MKMAHGVRIICEEVIEHRVWEPLVAVLRPQLKHPSVDVFSGDSPFGFFPKSSISCSS